MRRCASMVICAAQVSANVPSPPSRRIAAGSQPAGRPRSASGPGPPDQRVDDRQGAAGVLAGAGFKQSTRKAMPLARAPAMRPRRARSRPASTDRPGTPVAGRGSHVPAIVRRSPLALTRPRPAVIGHCGVTARNWPPAAGTGEAMLLGSLAASLATIASRPLRPRDRGIERRAPGRPAALGAVSPSPAARSRRWLRRGVPCSSRLPRRGQPGITPHGLRGSRRPGEPLHHRCPLPRRSP